MGGQASSFEYGHQEALLETHEKLTVALVAGRVDEYTQLLYESFGDCNLLNSLPACGAKLACGTYGCVFATPLKDPEGKPLVLKLVFQAEPAAHKGSAAWAEVAIGLVLTWLMSEKRIPKVFMSCWYVGACISSQLSDGCALPAAFFLAKLHHTLQNFVPQTLPAFTIPVPAKVLRHEALDPDVQRTMANDMGTATHMGHDAESMTLYRYALEDVYSDTNSHLFLLSERFDMTLQPHRFSGEIMEQILVLLASGLIAANHAVGFSHRDLHYGNVMLRRATPPGHLMRSFYAYCAIRLFDKTFIVNHFQGYVPMVLDYGLARVEIGGVVVEDSTELQEDYFGSASSYAGPCFDLLLFVKSWMDGVKDQQVSPPVMTLFARLFDLAGGKSWSKTGRPVLTVEPALSDVETEVEKAGFSFLKEITDEGLTSLIKLGGVLDLRYNNKEPAPEPPCVTPDVNEGD
jgi:hypothetical protein